jgi:hypothetical protein
MLDHIWFSGSHLQIVHGSSDPIGLDLLLSTLQSAVLAFFLLPDRSAWKIRSLFELSCYIFSVSPKIP